MPKSVRQRKHVQLFSDDYWPVYKLIFTSERVRSVIDMPGDADRFEYLNICPQMVPTYYWMIGMDVCSKVLIEMSKDLPVPYW